jgi:hypothetical protein
MALGFFHRVLGDLVSSKDHGDCQMGEVDEPIERVTDRISRGFHAATMI